MDATDRLGDPFGGLLASLGKPFITLTVPFDPVPCPRPRFVTRGKFTSTYYPAKYKDYKQQFGDAIGHGEDPISGPVVIATVFYVQQGKGKPTNPYPNPDLDNFVKSVWDGITSVGGYWIDDKQVVASYSAKVWCPRGEKPRTEVYIWSADELDTRT